MSILSDSNTVTALEVEGDNSIWGINAGLREKF